MTSKLFHTVVGFGIALGAATMGCSAESADGSVSANSAETATNTDPAQTTPAPNTDPFCEVGWPTTKGGARPARQQACIDPANECGAYPGLHFQTSQDLCVKGVDAQSCLNDAENSDAFLFCKAGDGGSHDWACPSGTIRLKDCTGFVDPPTPPATTGNDNGSGASATVTNAGLSKAAGY